MATKKKSPKAAMPNPIRTVIMDCSKERIFPMNKNLAKNSEDFIVQIEATDFMNPNKERRKIRISGNTLKGDILVELDTGKKPLSLGPTVKIAKSLKKKASKK